MFHLLIGLTALVLFVVFGALILFFITVLLVSIFGGASAALIVKDKTIKRLLFIGFSIMFLSASTFLLPFLGANIEFPAIYYPMICALIFILTGILIFAGFKTANSIIHKIGRIVAIIAFSILCVFSIPIIILFGVIMLRINT